MFWYVKIKKNTNAQQSVCVHVGQKPATPHTRAVSGNFVNPQNDINIKKNETRNT